MAIIFGIYPDCYRLVNISFAAPELDMFADKSRFAPREVCMEFYEQETGGTVVERWMLDEDEIKDLYFLIDEYRKETGQ